MIRLLNFSKKPYKWLLKPYKGSTLIETLTAMVLLLLIILLFYHNLDKLEVSMNPLSYYKASLIARKEFLKEDILLDNPEKYQVNGYIIKKEIIPLDTKAEIKQIKIEVFLMEGKTIYVQKKIISSKIEF